MKETFILRNVEDITPLVAWIKGNLDQTPIEVVAHAGACSRSVQQNRLMWKWNTEIGNAQGYTKDEIHTFLKRKFAVPIFTRDNRDYAQMVEAVKGVRKLNMLFEAECLAKEITRLTTTTDFTTDQMAEYLKDIEHYAAGEGIELSIPLT